MCGCAGVQVCVGRSRYLHTRMVYSWDAWSLASTDGGGAVDFLAASCIASRIASSTGIGAPREGSLAPDKRGRCYPLGRGGSQSTKNRARLDGFVIRQKQRAGNSANETARRGGKHYNHPPHNDGLDCGREGRAPHSASPEDPHAGAGEGDGECVNTDPLKRSRDKPDGPDPAASPERFAGLDAAEHEVLSTRERRRHCRSPRARRRGREFYVLQP